jgi:hypothetical protein
MITPSAEQAQTVPADVVVSSPAHSAMIKEKPQIKRHSRLCREISNSLECLSLRLVSPYLALHGCDMVRKFEILIPVAQAYITFGDFNVGPF